MLLAYLELLCISYLVKRSKGNHDKTQDREESLTQDSWNLKLSSSTTFDFVVLIVMVVAVAVAVAVVAVAAAVPVVVIFLSFLARKKILFI